MFILDSHCDTPSWIVRGRDIGRDNPLVQVDFPKLHEGGVSASFFALYIPHTFAGDKAASYALSMISGVYDAVEANSSVAAMAFSARDVDDVYASGRTAILMGMENGSPIGDSLSLLRLFHRLGVRYVTLTHNGDNLIADAAAEGRTWHGLSAFGREVVAEMNRLGMIVDVAHVSDETFWDCMKYSKAPIVSTHSCCRALAGHRRNMTDDMIRAMASEGGVIQINFYPCFLSDEFDAGFGSSELSRRADRIESEFIADPCNPLKLEALMEVSREMLDLQRPDVASVVDHIDHAVEIAGIDHVGIGSDFDGIQVPPRGLEDVSKIGAVFVEMRRRGYSESDIAKVAGGNFMRVFRAVESASCRG